MLTSCGRLFISNPPPPRKGGERAMERRLVGKIIKRGRVEDGKRTRIEKHNLELAKEIKVLKM